MTGNSPNEIHEEAFLSQINDALQACLDFLEKWGKSDDDVGSIEAVWCLTKGKAVLSMN